MGGRSIFLIFLQACGCILTPHACSAHLGVPSSSVFVPPRERGGAFPQREIAEGAGLQMASLTGNA